MTLIKEKISLVKDTIDSTDIDILIKWLQTNPRLTKGEKTIEFERRWSEWLGVKYSVFCNSGSSANLAAIYSLLISGKLKTNKIVVPAVSWVTTVSPTIHLGMEPILCDCDINTLGLDIDHFKFLVKTHKPSAVVLVHVLGVPNKMYEIQKICKDNNIIIIEDSCEAVGSEYNGVKVGSIGNIGTFSFYFGHHISTIEGGMISTNDKELYHLMLSIRSHGWDRDLPGDERDILRKDHNVTPFRALYTFYYPGFNLRSTDLQAFIGLTQLEKIDTVVDNRCRNFKLYSNIIKNSEWKIKPENNMKVSGFAYPIITNKIDELISKLNKNNIETRPLICGSINKQPFWYKQEHISTTTTTADWLHDHGLYLPNNHDMTEEDIIRIAGVVNSV